MMCGQFSCYEENGNKTWYKCVADPDHEPGKHEYEVTEEVPAELPPEA
jgi:hypothetical protein